MGTLQDKDSVAAAEAAAKVGLATQLEAFVANTMEYLKRERELLIEGIGVPELRTKLAGRHVLVVVRGYHYREDLAVLRGYIREYRRCMIGVDGGADALIEAGHKPHIIVGDMDSVSDKALGCGAELVVHAYPDGRAPGQARVQDLGLTLVAASRRRDQRGRGAAAGRREGRQPDRRGRHPVLAGGVPRQGPVGRGQHVPDPAAGRRHAGRAQGGQPALPQPHLGLGLLLLVLAACVTIVVAIGFSPAGSILLGYFGSKWDAFYSWLTG